MTRLIGLAALMACIITPAPTALALAPEGEPQQIVWADLMPEGEKERLAELYLEMRRNLGPLSGFDGEDPAAPQVGTFNTVEDLNGAYIRMPGFVLPFDYTPDGEITEFLLVPHFGACIHTPPPPPNQVVFVQTATPVKVKAMWDPVWVEGVLSTEKNLNGLGDAAYTLELTSVEPYSN